MAEGAAARVNDLLTTPYKIAEFAASPAGDEFRSRPEVFLARLAAAGVKHAQRLAFDIPSGKAFDDATKPLREGSIRERCAAAGGLAVDVATILPVARLARVGGGVLRSLEALGKPVQLAGEYELGYRVSQGGRSLAPLTEGQKLDVVEYSRALNLPEDKIAFMEEGATGYLGNWDYMMVGRDVAPNPQAGLGTRSANGRVSLRGAVAHELVGHREAHLAGRTQANLVLEEAQASIRAARFAPGLTSTERITLLRDGVARLNQNGYRIRQVKSELFIEVR